MDATQTRADLQQQLADRDTQLVARYKSGETVKALAREFGMHHGSVREVFVEAGVILRTRRRLTQADIDEVVRLYETGATTTEIGERFGVYASTIGRQFIKLGVALRPAAPRPKRT